MNETTSYCIVLTAISNNLQAEGLAKKVIEAKLAACAQLTTIHSFYTWKGEVCSEPEILISMKSKSSDYDELEEFIKTNHPYDTPEIVRLPIVGGSRKYFDWIDEVTGR